jgi:alpha-tubulin suppressor-like RCC1 family protein
MRRVRFRWSVPLFAAALLVLPLRAAADGPPGSVIAWGCSSLYPAPCAVPAAAASGVSAISSGLAHALALKRDGRVIAWGCPGDFDRGQCAVPAAATSGVTAVSAGSEHSLAVKNGRVIAWGCKDRASDAGECKVPAEAASGVTAVAAGSDQSLALKKDGRVIAWGCGGTADYYGQCTLPAEAKAGVTAIAGGLRHSVALKAGRVIAWGCRDANPVTCTVPAAATSGVTAIAAGPFHSLALANGGVVAWGCAFGINAGQCDVPPAARSGVTAIAAGGAYSLALKNGEVLVWGCVSPGQNLNTAPCKVPAAASGASVIAAGGPALALFALSQQAITVRKHAPRWATYGQRFSVAASASSGLAVAYSSGGACSNAGASFTMRSGTGTCRVSYAQPGSGSFGSARQLIESVGARKATQRITFGALAAKTYGAADFRVRATASSGLRVSFAARGTCRVRGTRVHLTSAGSCTLTASQRGNANYTAATPVSRRFTIAPRR